jgi:hypothetical protein
MSPRRQPTVGAATRPILPGRDESGSDEALDATGPRFVRIAGRFRGTQAEGFVRSSCEPSLEILRERRSFRCARISSTILRHSPDKSRARTRGSLQKRGYRGRSVSSKAEASVGLQRLLIERVLGLPYCSDGQRRIIRYVDLRLHGSSRDIDLFGGFQNPQQVDSAALGLGYHGDLAYLGAVLLVLDTSEKQNSPHSYVARLYGRLLHWWRNRCMVDRFSIRIGSPPVAGSEVQVGGRIGGPENREDRGALLDG